MKKFLPEAIVLCAIMLVVRYGFAQTWTKTSASISLSEYSMAVSADGKIIMAIGSGAPLRSTNSGVTWTTNSPVGNYYGLCCALSADGTKILSSFFSSNPKVFVSTNTGNTWTQTSLPSKLWTSCASSADGVKLAVADNGDSFIYKSTDSGVTWLTNNTPSENLYSLASSADGTRLAAVALNNPIYISTDSGLTWASTSSTFNSLSLIASSADGTHLVATGGSNTYISTNSGSSWTTNNIDGSGGGVASSADGSKLVICNRGGWIYISTNFGISWTSTNIVGKQWFCVASSADGNELIAGERQGIWIYKVTPTPKLNLTDSNNSVAVSWPVPSTNFVLQQNLDLATTNWVTLTNTPVLNLTNLNNELTLPPSNSSGFFRLMTQ